MKKVEATIAYGLTLAKGGRLKADRIANPETPWMAKHFNEILTSNRPVLIATEGTTWVVSDWPMPDVPTISNLGIATTENGSTHFRGTAHGGQAGEIGMELSMIPLWYVVTAAGRIVAPASSPLAKAA